MSPEAEDELKDINGPAISVSYATRLEWVLIACSAEVIEPADLGLGTSGLNLHARPKPG